MNELNEYLKRNKIKCLYHATYDPVLSSIELTGLGAHPTERINSWMGLWDYQAQTTYILPTPQILQEALPKPLIMRRLQKIGCGVLFILK
jgi:hypothetical protein